MKLRDHRLAGRENRSIANQEIIRAGALIAESKSNSRKSCELRHTAKNLQTVSRLMREQISWRRQRNLNNG